MKISLNLNRFISKTNTVRIRTKLSKKRNKNQNGTEDHKQYQIKKNSMESQKKLSLSFELCGSSS